MIVAMELLAMTSVFVFAVYRFFRAANLLAEERTRQAERLAVGAERLALARYEHILAVLREALNPPRVARILVVGRSLDGSAFGWGRTVSLRPGTTHREQFPIMLPLQPHTLVGAIGDGIIVTGIYFGQSDCAAFYGDGLFGSTHRQLRPGETITVELQAR